MRKKWIRKDGKWVVIDTVEGTEKCVELYEKDKPLESVNDFPSNFGEVKFASNEERIAYRDWCARHNRKGVRI